MCNIPVYADAGHITGLCAIVICMDTLFVTQMKYTPFLCCLFLCGTAAHAQTEYSIFKDSSTVQPPVRGLSLRVDNFNYFRNNEYFGHVEWGYTLFGYQLQPTLQYRLTDKLTLQGGAFLQREFGREGYVVAAPYYNVTYRQKGYTVRVGNLHGAANHSYIEPIVTPEATLTDRVEQGLQITADKRHLWADAYIDWEKAIRWYDNYPEQFTSGISARLKPMPDKKLWVEVPLQLMVAHRGGQIDTCGIPIESLLNTAVGVSFNYTTNSTLVPWLSTAHYYVYYKNLTYDRNVQPYISGDGYFASLTAHTKYNVDIDLRYWTGAMFIGPRGFPLYSSASQVHDTLNEDFRTLLFMNVIYNKQFGSNLYLDVRAEPYYNFGEAKLEIAYAVYMRIRFDALLLKRTRLMQ